MSNGAILGIGDFYTVSEGVVSNFTQIIEPNSDINLSFSTGETYQFVDNALDLPTTDNLRFDLTGGSITVNTLILTSQCIPEPSFVLGLLVFGGAGLLSSRKRVK